MYKTLKEQKKLERKENNTNSVYNECIIYTKNCIFQIFNTILIFLLYNVINTICITINLI
jgi:hypothetical protein